MPRKKVKKKTRKPARRSTSLRAGSIVTRRLDAKTLSKHGLRLSKIGIYDGKAAYKIVKAKATKPKAAKPPKASKLNRVKAPKPPKVPKPKAVKPPKSKVKRNRSIFQGSWGPPIRVGMMLVSESGVTMRRVYFHRVTAISPPKVTIVHVPEKYVSGDMQSGRVVPNLNATTSSPHTYRLDPSGTMVRLGRSYAYAWSGKPEDVFGD